MAIRVQTPDGNIAEFPDGMPDTEIEAVLAREYGQKSYLGVDNFKPAAPKTKTTTAEAFLDNIVRSGTFGTSDEAPALNEASPLRQRMVSQGVGSPIINPVDMAIGGGRLLLEKVAPSIFGNAGTQAYDKSVKEARDLEKLQAEEHPVASFAGKLVGGALVPVGQINNLKQGLKVGGLLGAAYGFGEGEGLSGSLKSAAIGGAGGAALGGLLGHVVGGGTGGGSAAVASQPAAGKGVIEAADRLGVDVPRVLATDNMATMRIGQGLSHMPIAGDPIKKAIEAVPKQLGEKAAELSAKMGSGSVETAGEAAGRGIQDWISRGSKGITQRAYDRVDAAMTNPAARTALDETGQTVANIMAQRAASKIQGSSPAISEVFPAVQGAEGLTYEGLKGLRTHIGEKLNNNLTGLNGSQNELKAIYGSLSDDLRSAVAKAGGDPALNAFSQANRVNAKVADRRDALSAIVGKDGSRSPAQIVDRIKAAAASTSRQDVGLLMQAKRSMPKEAWDEVASTIVARLGRDAEGNFSPLRFVSDYGKLNEHGKRLLFGKVADGTHRKALEDIAAVSSRMKEAARFGNPSGTAQVGAVIAGVTADPIVTLSSVVGGRVLSELLARPQSATSVARWAKAAQTASNATGAASRRFLETASRQLSAAIASHTGDAIPISVLTNSVSRRPARAEEE